MSSSFLARSLVLACLAVGCSVESAEPTLATPALAHPPARPSVSSVGTTRWFVVDSYRLGLTDRHGVSSPDAWKQYGFDLDGRATSRDDVTAGRTACRRPVGSATSALVDGQAGIDNLFGGTFMSIMKSLQSDVEELTNKAVAAGGYTLVLRLDDVSTASDDAYAPGALFLVGRKEKASFAADEKWPVAGTSLEPIATFPAGYVTHGTWVSGDLGTELPHVAVPMAGDALVAPLYGGVLTLDLAAGEGMMAGALRTADFAEMLKPYFKRFGICPGDDSFAGLVNLVTGTADALATLPLSSDPSRNCDAMSLGVAFTVKPMGGVEGVTGAVPTPVDGCVKR